MRPSFSCSNAILNVFVERNVSILESSLTTSRQIIEKHAVFGTITKDQAAADSIIHPSYVEEE